MWKKIRRVLMIVLAAVFLFCGGTVAVVQHQYNISKRLYRAASDTFTSAASAEELTAEQAPAAAPAPEESARPSRLNDGVYRLPEKAPIKVDFAALQKVNPDVDGWIYCPGTVIDYPVMHGASNDTYLHHSYDGTYNASGSIFVDERNQRYFADPVTILYGHHMASGAMFATLQWWWLLTPDQDYKVELYSAYTTSAYSNTYEIPLAGTNPSNYIWMAENSSDWHINPDLDPTAHYIVMSTCAYIFEDARSVLHGKLVPVMTAGGELIR